MVDSSQFVTKLQNNNFSLQEKKKMGESLLLSFATESIDGWKIPVQFLF